MYGPGKMAWQLGALLEDLSVPSTPSGRLKLPLTPAQGALTYCGLHCYPCMLVYIRTHIYIHIKYNQFLKRYDLCLSFSEILSLED